MDAGRVDPLRRVAVGLGVVLLSGAASWFGGCAPERRVAEEAPTPLDEALARLDERDPWERHGPLDLPRHPAERYLAGWVIVLDPGHGGDAHRAGYKRGPTGVREAEMNWRVAVLLRRLLDDAGAHVTLTRDGDVDVSLRDRAMMANTVRRPDGGRGADLFISLHHNASSRPEANYTSVWFHGRADWSEPDLDPARYVAHEIGDHLRTQVGFTSPLMSDQQMYETGFGVLRHSDVPAFLVEASFFSNPDEEQRLRDARYNLREAYAIYRGLCEYAYGGRPTQSTPAVELDGSTLRVTTTLDDGLPEDWWGHDRQRTLSSTIHVTLDGTPMPTRYEPATHELTAELPLESRGGGDREDEPATRHLSIHHANFFKHHNWPQRYAVNLARDDGAWAVVGVEPVGPIRAGRDDQTRDVAATPPSSAPAPATPLLDVRAEPLPRTDDWPIVAHALEITTDDGPLRGFVAVVDLTDPRVDVDVTAPLDEPISDDPEVEARLIPTDEWARDVDAALAINANFFAWKKPEGASAIVGLSVSDGRVVSPPRVHDGREDPAIVFLEDRTARVDAIGPDELDGVVDGVAGVGASETVPDLTGPIVTDGRNTGASARVAPLKRHPRTGIGVDAAGEKLIVVALDGRQEGWSVGATLPELADVLIAYGADDAINLDGGGSTSFVYDAEAATGEPAEPITNRPSDGEFRPVANHLGIRVRPSN